MSYHHLTIFERSSIELLCSMGLSNRAMAEKLGRHRSCIDREILRNSRETGYVAETAQRVHAARRKNATPNGKCTAELVTIITDKLIATWSPEQIANTVTLGTVGFKTIYNWIYRGLLPKISVIQLRQKGRRKKAEKRGKFSRGIPISKRPNDVKARKTFGHWELAIYEKLGVTLYFADAYCSWQRGSNENSNGLLREFYPKKTNLALVAQEDLSHNLFLINSRPRKCLGWNSPIQVFLAEVAHLT